jgi:hypothetical protein
MQESFKDKSNPDIIKKTNENDSTRKNTKFRLTSITYNSITNNTPAVIKKQKDLELEKDKPINNISNNINQKLKERKDQDTLYKPPKHKINVVDQNSNNELIQNFNELKNDQKLFTVSQKNSIELNKNKYDNIICNLKDLGIITNNN